ncbi:MAG: hypothetical protein A2252_10930 [Elusimicrobia bacterium RIFOXYA2_FULL_39_19]|nr:MAG: hypothetical protein A2252_10930 [Elusimicrobia bacterium RIFOXYA2_FULL_39_19]
MKPALIALTLIIGISNCFAEVGQAGWQILRKPQSARPQAINNSVYMKSDLSGVFYNSAVLGTLKSKEAFFISETGASNDMFGGVLYGTPVGEKSGLCAGALYYDAGKMDLFWMEGTTEHTRTVTSQRDVLAIIAYGKHFSDRLYTGITVKYANSNIAETQEAVAYAGDIGLIYVVNSKINVSVSGQNIGSSSKFITKAEELPTTASAGISYFSINNENSYLAFGVEVPYIIKEGRVTPNLAVEYCLGKIAFDIGYKLNVEESQLQAGLSFGINRNMNFSYAFLPARYLAHTHRLNLGVKF